MITAEQVSKARDLLRWSIHDLARWSKVGHAAIFHFEIGTADLCDEGIARIKEVLEANGVESSRASRRGSRRSGEPGVRGKMITADQMKVARALLGWSEVRLHEAGLDPSTIINFEVGTRSPSVTSVLTIESTLKAAGIEFPEHDQVTLRRKKR